MLQAMWAQFIRDDDSSPESVAIAQAAESLREHARTLAKNLAWMPSVRSSDVFRDRCQQLSEQLGKALRARDDKTDPAPSWSLLCQNATLLESCLSDVNASLHGLHRISHVRREDGSVIPRPLDIIEEFLATTKYRCSERLFTLYISAYQEVTVLDLLELWTLVASMKLVLLERLVHSGRIEAGSVEDREEAAVCIESLRRINEISWRRAIESLIAFDPILEKDPVGAYSRMDAMSRDLYRNEVAAIARHSDLSEQEVATTALELAERAQRTPHPDPRVAERLGHIGYYLVAEGARELKRRASFRPPFLRMLQDFVRSRPDDIYLPAIALLTAVLAATLINLSEFEYRSFLTYIFMLAVLVLPCSEAAVQIVNFFVLSLLHAKPIPKLDFRDGIPSSCATLVTVPMLLLNEEQVRKAVDDLEVRYLGNHDPSLHFALLTDRPDSPTQPAGIDLLASLCASLIDNLNEKYKDNHAGSFFLLHRERRYNPRERTWMGWERKRGKLLELNRLLRGDPVDYTKTAGDLALLSNIRFVISLDADTLLPRDTARRLIATLAHPLNQVIIDPETNIAVAGYGILQPRVGVSVRSAASSRLAKIWSGQTGLDIYTRAISDVYQDLYGEGTYVGKGIYDVEALHRILDGRFPSNLLLSHDLIESAYTRSGLVSDIEIIEDYPSAYSAFNRRKHRWLRGDWQIAEWLLPRVPGPRGRRVANPISLVSKWKIFDNLRRSLVEPATLLLFVLGWLVLPGSPLYWTIATVCLLFLPNIVRLIFDMVRAVFHRGSSSAGTLPESLLAENMGVVLTLVFLAHQMLLSLDAMVRALIRRLVTGERMLEWVTAAQEENELDRRTPLDVYLDWTPALAFGLGVLVWFVGGSKALFVALPILVLWASSKFISMWLNRSPHTRYEKSLSDRIFLRQIALRTWRFFEEFSAADTGWLIPDNVYESPPKVDRRLSSTNLGFLFNARQVACEFGYLTLPEFVDLSQKTLDTVARLRRYRGHFFNWYDAVTHEPLPPFEVSSVDSGNLVASLWTLEQGCLDLLKRPLIDSQFAAGATDYMRELVRMGALDRRTLSSYLRQAKTDWLKASEDLSPRLRPPSSKPGHDATDSQWYFDQLEQRIENLNSMVRTYAPWLLPEFRPLSKALDALGFGSPVGIGLQRIPEFVDALASRLVSERQSGSVSTEQEQLKRELFALLPAARNHVGNLIRDLKSIARDADNLAAEMDFRFLLNPGRKLLAVGFNTQTQQPTAACYDLLASEARVALFVAIAKNDVPQESWFALTRRHNVAEGRVVLLSWSGTMFEYLMPCLWMHTYPDTLLDRAEIEAVHAQRSYAVRRGVPWGISESASAEKTDEGIYAYYAFGLPDLALRDSHPSALVISPYASALAQHISPRHTLRNLRRMERSGWLGKYGLYESVDFSSERGSGKARPEIVRIWMAHHQGMILLSIANSLYDGVVRRWFHSKPAVRSTELLLQEKPLTNITRQAA